MSRADRRRSKPLGGGLMVSNVDHMAGGIRITGTGLKSRAEIERWSECERECATAVLKALSTREPVVAAKIISDRVLLAEKALLAGLPDGLADDLDISSVDHTTLERLTYVENISMICAPDVLERINDKSSYIEEDEAWDE